MLKAGHHVFLPALEKLFNILTEESFPVVWKHSTITPLHKSGDANLPDNYRGIAVTSNLSKLFCSVLHNRLVQHI